MASKVAVFALVAVLPAKAALVSLGTERQLSLENAWSTELNNEGVSPIKRVVGLIQKMKAELEAEAANEAEMYDKMVCWCETGVKEKTKAIADADATMIDLESEIQARAANVGSLSANIENMKKQIAEDTAALAQAEQIRDNEAKDARSKEKDLIQATANLRNAVEVLKKVQLVQGSKSLLQLGAPLLSSLRVVLRDVAFKHETMSTHAERGTAFVAIGSGSSKSPSDLLSVFGAAADDELPLKFAEQMLAKSATPSTGSMSFLQASAATASAATAPGESYSSGSNGIFGIMTQMLDEFKADLASNEKDESTAVADFKAMKAAKQKQLDVGKEKLDTMEADGAGNLKALSDAKENHELTINQRSADVKFLQNLKLTCGDLDAQWAKRSATRAAEIKAVSETLVILTEDSAQDQFNKNGASLLQVSSKVAQARRSNAAEALRRAAQAPSFDAEDLLADWHGRSVGSHIGAGAGPRAQLSTLAMTVQLDSFKKVKEMMDKLVAELKTQQEEEVKLKAYCQKEFSENEKAVFDKNEEKEDLEANMEQLASLMKKLASEIDEAKKQTADTQLEMKKASENREKENAEFQTTVADQRATQDILKKALTRLQDFYVKGKGKAAFAQQSQTPPVQFNKQKDNAGASPVMGLLEQVIEDSAALVKEATEEEYKAQADYETMIKDSNDLVKELTTAVTEKTKASAAAKTEAGQAKSDHTSAVGELESLAAYEGDLHGQCDFVVANFDIRQKARLQEIEAIQQAKGILSGA